MFGTPQRIDVDALNAIEKVAEEIMDEGSIVADEDDDEEEESLVVRRAANLIPGAL